MKIKLLNGYVVAPEDTVVLDATKTEKANYCGIIYDHFQMIYPHLFFSDTPVKGLSKDTEDMMIDWAAMLIPDIAHIRDQEASAGRLYDARPGILSSEERLEMNRLYIYDVPTRKIAPKNPAKPYIIREEE